MRYAYSLSVFGLFSAICSFYGSFILMTNEGLQQLGNALRPLLFSNTVHPLLRSLQTELVLR